MNYLLSLEWTLFEVIYYSYVVLYGLFYGLHNTVYRIQWLLMRRDILQAWYGKLLDYTWYLLITSIVIDLVYLGGI